MFVRFPTPAGDPWVAVNEGYEIQIHDTAPEPIHQTGRIYWFAAPSMVASNPPGSWNHYSIRASVSSHAVVLNGREVDALHRGVAGAEGYVGLQNHDPKSLVRFRRVTVTALTEQGPRPRSISLVSRPRRYPRYTRRATTPTAVNHGDQWKPPLLSCSAAFADSTTRLR